MWSWYETLQIFLYSSQNFIEVRRSYSILLSLDTGSISLSDRKFDQRGDCRKGSSREVGSVKMLSQKCRVLEWSIGVLQSIIKYQMLYYTFQRHLHPITIKSFCISINHSAEDLGSDKASLCSQFVPLPNHKTFSVSTEVKLTLIQRLFLYDRQNFLPTLEKLFESIEIQSLSQRTFRTQQIELILGLIRCTNDHTITIEASQRSWFEIGKYDDFSFHFFNWNVFLKT